MTNPDPIRLRVSERDAEKLRRAAVAAYPLECCGLLVGEGEDEIVVTAICPAANTADDPRRMFAIDPQTQFDLLRATRDSGRRVIGHYHSHPDGGGMPSSQDLSMAYDPEALWIVVAAAAGAASPPRAFRRPAGADGFVEVPIVISTTEPDLASTGTSL